MHLLQLFALLIYLLELVAFVEDLNLLVAHVYLRVSGIDLREKHI